MFKKTLVAAAILSLTSLSFAGTPAVTSTPVDFPSTDTLDITNHSAQAVTVHYDKGEFQTGVGLGQQVPFQLPSPDDQFTSIYDAGNNALAIFDYSNHKINVFSPTLIHQGSGAYQLLGCGDNGQVHTKNHPGSRTTYVKMAGNSTYMTNKEANLVLFTNCDLATTYIQNNTL